MLASQIQISFRRMVSQSMFRKLSKRCFGLSVLGLVAASSLARYFEQGNQDLELSGLPQVEWAEVQNCCGVVQVALENNVVCFDLDYRRGGLQSFCELSPLSEAYSWYLQMAKSFLQDVLRNARLRLKVAWRIEDDSTISESNLRILKELGIVAVAHSVHKNANTTLYTTFVPNFHFIETHGFRKLIQELENPEVPLQHRRPSVFWAGSTTGLPCGSVKPCENTCDNIQRVKLVQLGNALTWTSFSITRAIQWCTSDALRLQDLTTEYVKEVDWIQHRGLIDVDGNVDAWGLTWRLASGSVVFRVRSSYLNYFSDRILEGIHFLSIAEDLSDLAEVTAKVTLMQNADELSRISQNAKKVILENSYDTIVDTVSKVLGG